MTGTAAMRRLLLAIALSAAALCAQEAASHQETAAPESLTWKWVNFGLLAFGLGYLMAKSLPPMFRGRTTEIQKDINEAQKTKREAEERAAAIEKRVSALAADIEAFRGQARGEMEQEAARIREETARQMEKLKRQAGLEIETAGKNAQRELQTYAAKLALELAEQRIRTRLDSSASDGLVDDFVHDLRTEESRN